MDHGQRSFSLDRRDMATGAASYGEALRRLSIGGFPLQRLVPRANTAARRSGANLPEGMQPFESLPPADRRAHVHEWAIRARQASHTLRAVVEQMPLALVLLDGEGRILDRSHAAERLLRARDGLLRRQGRLYAPHADDNRRLQHLLDVLRLPVGTAVAASAVLIHRRGSTRPLRVSGFSLGGPSPLTRSPAPVSVLLIGEAQAGDASATELLQREFSLTGAEASRPSSNRSMRRPAAAVTSSSRVGSSPCTPLCRSECRRHSTCRAEVLRTDACASSARSITTYVI